VPRVRRLIIAVLLGSALTLVACSGSEDKGDGGDDRLPATAYRAQLTRLCAESEQEAAKIGGVQGANAAALAEYFDKIAAVQTARRKHFDALRPPAELQDEHAKIAPLLGQEIAAIQQAATGFRAGSDPMATYDTYKKSQAKVLREQGELLKTMKVAGCQTEAEADAGSAPGSS